MTVWTWIAVALVGGAGAIARFVVDREVGRRFGGAFPYGTLMINLSGSFLLGLVTGLALSTDALLIIGTATIGSYTTFSTWMFETYHLASEKKLALAAANVILSLTVGLGALALGHLITA